MRLGSVTRAQGPWVPWGPDWIYQVPPMFRVPRGGRGHRASRQVLRGSDLSGEASAAHGLRVRPLAAIAEPATPSDPRGPPSDQASAVSRQRRPGSGASLFSSDALSGFHAAWLVAAALLLSLALLSAVSDPPRTPSPDELARASLRTPHERATSVQY